MKMVVKIGGGNDYGAGNCDLCGDDACGGDGGGDDDDDDADCEVRVMVRILR